MYCNLYIYRTPNGKHFLCALVLYGCLARIENNSTRIRIDLYLPLASWLLACLCGNAFWVAGVGKVADGGNTEVGELTNPLESPA